MSKNVDIVGAGPAGLTAAIILKREGYNPTVYEAEKTFGGDPSWHPSVHGTPINLDVLEAYTGIDFSPVFHEIKDVGKNYRYYWNLDLKPRPGFDPEKDWLYTVERGPRESSLDGFLYKKAIEDGIPVIFNSKWGAADFKNAKPNTIVATGLGQSAYEARGVKFTPFYGYWTSQPCDPERVDAATYAGDFTNEYAYVCTANGLWYCLLFAKGDVSKEELEKFNEIIGEIEGLKLTMDSWKRFTGASVRNPMLFDGNLIFVGTAAGLIEPARGYGILSALWSGRLGATAVYDREKAQAEYDKYMEPIKKNVALKFKEKKDYVTAVFMDRDALWFDLPTIKSRVRDKDINK